MKNPKEEMGIVVAALEKLQHKRFFLKLDVECIHSNMGRKIKVVFYLSIHTKAAHAVKLYENIKSLMMMRVR